MALTVHSNAHGGFLLHRNDEAIGWVEGRAVGFRGFPDAEAALGAAEVAYRALRSWLAREQFPGPEVTREDAPLDRRTDGGVEWLTLDGVPVGRLVAPGDPAGAADATFGFELLLPRGVNTVAGIGAAQVIHNALVRWKGARELAPAGGGAATSPGGR